MRVLLIQLCRMGDVIQTLPLVDALIGRGDEVHLLVRESMQELPLARKGLHLHYVVVPAAEDERLASLVEELLSRLEDLNVELSINLSFDEPGALIATYLAPPTSLGLTMGRDRRTRALDSWTQYLLSVPEHRRQGPFNLAQVYGHLAGLAIGPDHVARCTPSPDRPSPPLLAELNAKRQPAPRIGLVPGASDIRKRWPVHRFAELAQSFTAEGTAICLLGSPDERSLGTEIRGALRSPGDVDLVYDWIGQTGLEDLCAILSSLDLVVTNDTGTMHLAAALGVQTVTVTLGPAHVFESAPFAPNHFTIESSMPCHPCEFSSYCADTACGPAIPSDVVLQLARYALGGGESVLSAPSAPESETRHRAFISRFDEQGRIYPKPLQRNPLSTTEWMRSLYQSVWEQSLSGARSAATPAEIVVSLEDRWDIASAGGLVPELERIGTVLDDYNSTIERATSELLEIATSATGRERLEDIATGLEGRLELIGGVEPQLAPLTTFVLTQLSMAGGRNPAQALTDMLTVLSSGLDRGRLLADSMKQTKSALLGSPGHRPATVPTHAAIGSPHRQ